jgi:integrase
MATQTSPQKAGKGSVQIKNSNGRLQLVFSHAGKRHYLSLGFMDSRSSRKMAEMRAREIELDLLSGNFDPTLAKYKPETALNVATGSDLPIQPEAEQVSLMNLWEKYTEFKTPQLAQATIAKDYVKTASHLRNAPSDSPADAVRIRDHWVQTLTPDAAKRCLTQLSACCKWAMKSGLIDQNPFKDMATEIRLPKGKKDDTDINPFSAQERDAIVQAFESNPKYRFYTALVKFLFSTGCRPSEAVGLRWKHVSNDFQFIQFEEAVTVSLKGLARKEGLKTQERRRFPCNQSLKTLLKSIKPLGAQPDDLVFPSPKGKYVDFHNFRNRGWLKTLDLLKIDYRKPYQTRHTFITLALEAGMDVKDVAKLVGNSPEVIYRHYAGTKQDLSVPEF